MCGENGYLDATFPEDIQGESNHLIARPVYVHAHCYHPNTN